MYIFLYINSFFSPAWMLGFYDSIEISGFIAHNVPGMRRLGQEIGLCVANVPCPKCGGDKTAQRA